MPKHKISPTIREQIRNVQARLDRLEDEREQKSPEDYEWFKRFGKRSSMFGEFERLMDELEREMAETIRKMEGSMPEEMLRETRRPDGSVRREYGPFVYGYSVKIGPDGKPVIREFGNMKPGIEEERPLSLHERREPLVDVIENDARASRTQIGSTSRS